MPKKQRIYDAVYGYVELNDIEFDLVTSPIFQRLHWIKQLGPLHTVFPSAQHSRFSHTIGVFHIVNKMIDHLENRPDERKYIFDEKMNEKGLLKFAALLHDIGHVPLSHVGEEVLKDTVVEGLREKTSTKTKGTKGIFDPFAEREPSWWDLFPEEKYHGGSTKLHERVSAEIVLHSTEIDTALSKVKGWETKERRQEAKEKIAKIIVGKDCLDVPTLLLHSELDADRLDYLLRDSFFTGVGYGRIDLDYIISRLAIFRDERNVADLCVEFKGLHTVEHYILGRFFLQTQVIYNRKVRFMDLLFRDVMKYMVKHRNEDCRLMGLEEICNCIRSKSAKNVHNLYSYTDAQVFSKMRTLHEELDRKEKENGTTQEESYINDCVKTIMDGRVPEPVFPTCQKLIDLREKKDYRDKLQKEAIRTAKKIAVGLGIYGERVKANLVEQDVMKYKESMATEDGPEAAANHEAVRILYRNPEGMEERKPAARSNASILCDLADKTLLIFNVYYVAPKNEDEKEANSKREAITKAFNVFATREFQPFRIVKN